MKNTLRNLCLVLLAMLLSTGGHAETTAFYLDAIVREAYAKDDIKALDKIAQKIRIEKTRTPSGNWHLSAFYVQLRLAMNEGRKHNSPEQWAQVEQKVNRWVASSPQSAVAPIALAYAQRRHAWTLRGDGYASTVTEKGWAGFARQMKAADRTLQANKKISSVDPQWYVEALDVALAQNRSADEYMALYEEGVSKEPLYYDIHTQAMERFLPIWGGSLEAVKAFADDAVKRTAALDGQILYAHLYLNLPTRVTPEDFERFRRVVVEQIKAGFDDVIKKYPSDWNKNVYARFACQIGAMGTFQRMDAQIKGKLDPEAWPKGYYDICVEHAKR